MLRVYVNLALGSSELGQLRGRSQSRERIRTFTADAVARRYSQGSEARRFCKEKEWCLNIVLYHLMVSDLDKIYYTVLYEQLYLLLGSF